MNHDTETFLSIRDKADAAGRDAVEKLRVIPMIVGQETYFGSGRMKPETIEYVESGVCGFAWVSVKPANKGNTRLGKEERKLLETIGFRKNEYEKCYQLWISDFNQSMQKKEAYASAYAKVLRENGIAAYSGSRLD
jgi:hypothetical protein